ncbi:DUF6249 domain-containing protein [Aquimarina litoralis]|uniref:DUF6249 domain-containing protein n=1 Tax=Aquimarina litoralis TaxID=584605 RepID=UPI001C5793F1|nr:DUF6249 domain-containing protein [Aquimarina litoralis]MBW1296407.1 hypothetical protein [Aquimarina litoralis]
MNGDIIVPITFIVSISGLIYLYLKTRHRERMAMIENGVSASSLYNKTKILAITLKIGMVSAGIGIGILIGNFVNYLFTVEDANVFYFAFTFIFGGLALILNYRIEKNKIDDY